MCSADAHDPECFVMVQKGVIDAVRRELETGPTQVHPASAKVPVLSTAASTHDAGVKHTEQLARAMCPGDPCPDSHSGAEKPLTFRIRNTRVLVRPCGA